MSCKYKYNNKWNSEEQVKKLIESEISKDDITLELLKKNSFVVEINTAKENKAKNVNAGYLLDDDSSFQDPFTEEYTGALNEYYVRDYNGNIVESFTNKEEAEKRIKELNESSTDVPTQYYSNLTVPGGTNYTENEIATPAITPNIKGHAQFATDKGIGWFRSDDKIKEGTELTKEKALQRASEDANFLPFDTTTNETTNSTTRRILELQSDLFQKWRNNFEFENNKYTAKKDDKNVWHYYKNGNEVNANEYTKTWEIFLNTYLDTADAFTKLLQKENNWVTFFVNSIIQDSAKKSYEKVLFPTGNTASKVEGHTTLEEFKKQKEDRIKELEEKKKTASNNKPWLVSEITGNKKHYFNTEEEANKFRRNNGRENFYSVVPTSSLKDSLKNVEDINNEIKQLKQELADVESGQTQLSSIAKFYEETITNILKKNGYNPIEITDEYGNTWNEIKITPNIKSEKIFLQRNLNPIQKIAKDFNINTRGFTESVNTDYTKLRRKLKPLGYNVKKAKTGKFYITRNGKFYNPWDIIVNEKFTPVIENSEINKDLISSEEMTKSDVIKILKEKGSEMSKVLIDIFETHLSDDLKIILNSSLSNANPGRYNSVTKTIELYPNNPDIENTLIHELLHDLTVNKINTPEAQAIRDVFEEFKKKLAMDRLRGFGLSFQGETSLEEFIVGVFTDKKLQDYLNIKKSKKQSLWSRLMKAIAKILNIRQDSLLAEAIISSIALMKTQNTFENPGLFNQLTAAKQQFYTSQEDNLTDSQKIVFRNILKIQSSYKLINNKEYLHIPTNTKLKRTSEYIKQLQGPNNEKDYYEFDSSLSDDYSDNREWGNQTDILLENIILGKTSNEAINEVLLYQNKLNASARIEKEKLINIYNQLNKFILEEKAKGIALLSQISIGNVKEQIAGTLDLIGIDQDGLVVIYDLKSSIYPTNSTKARPYKKISRNGIEVDEYYNKVYYKKGKRRASKRDRHSVQLSVYKGLSFSKGINVVDTKIIPILLSKNGLLEPIITLDTRNTVVKSVAFDYQPSVYQSEDTDTLNLITENIKLSLQEKLEYLIKTDDFKNQKMIKNILYRMTDIENLKAIEVFTNEAYKTLIGEKNQQGYINLVNSIIDEPSGNSLEMLNQLKFIKDTYELYKPVIKDIKLFFLQNKEIIKNSKQESTFDKIKKLYKAIELIEPKIKRNLNKLIAKELEKITNENANVREEAINAIQKKNEIKIKNREKKINEQLEKQKGLNPESKNWKIAQKTIESHKKIISELNEEINKYRNKFKIDAETIYEMLENGMTNDISFFDLMANPAIMSDNILIASFTRHLKDSFEKDRYQMVSELKHASDAIKEYNKSHSAPRDIPSKFNEGLYEIQRKAYIDENGEISYIENYSFVTKIDYNSYNAEKFKMEQQAREIQDDTKRKEFRIKWYRENTEIIPNEDEFIINPYTQEKVVLNKGLNTIKKELESRLTISEIEEMNKNIRKGIYPHQITRPKFSKYKNSNFDALVSNKSKYKYYEYLLSTYLKDQELLPSLNKNEYKFIIPSVIAENKERLTTNPLSIFTYYAKSFTAREEDVEEYGQDLAVPVMFRYNLKLEDTSLDLLQSIMRFKKEALNYKTRNEVLPFASSLLESVSNIDPIVNNKQGNLLKSAAEKIGIQNMNSYVRKHNGNNLAAMVEALIDVHIFNKTKKKETFDIFGKTVDYGKLTDALIQFSSLTQIGGNTVLSVTNSLMAEIQVGIESFASKHISVKSLARATLIYERHIPGMVSDFTKPVNKSFIGQLIDLYDPIQGNFEDAFGRKISSSTFSKLVSTNSWYWMMRQGEHHALVRTMIAMMLDTKIIDKNGNESSLYDAYEMKGGEIKLKEGFENNPLVNEMMKNKLHSLNKSLHGVYNSFDKSLMERYAIGRLLAMYRKFVVTGFKKRWKSEPYYDVELGDISEGTYITFFRVLRRDFKEMLKFLNPLSKESANLTPLEKENFIRALSEFLWIAFTGFALILLEGGDDDKDRSKANYFASVFALRVNSELGFYGGIGDPNSWGLPSFKDFYRIFRTPVIAIGILEKIIRLFAQLHDPTEVYERDAGLADKGDNKLMIRSLKLLGMDKINYLKEPEEALKVLKLQLN